jgi:hypothetical protein
VGDVGQASFRLAHSFVLRLAEGDLPLVVPLAFGRVAQMHDGHPVQHHVDLPVAATGSRWRKLSPQDASMGRSRSRTRSDLGREAGDVTDPGRQLVRA